MAIESEVAEQVLNLVFYESTLDRNMTVRDWFKELLITLLKEGEGFSGKRPFGNSSWDHEPAAAMVEAGLVKGTLIITKYSDGSSLTRSEEYDYEEVDRLLLLAAKYL